MEGRNLDSNDVYRCFNCSTLLIGPPAVALASGRDLCYQCYIVNPGFYLEIRKALYEELINNVILPCCYQGNGCEISVTSETAHQHEEFCHFKLQPCPMQMHSFCKWVGPFNDLMKHYELQHPYLKASLPFIYKINNNITIRANFLAEKFNFLFLIQIKYYHTTQKFSHCVRLLGNRNFARYFQYSAGITGTGYWHQNLTVRSQDSGRTYDNMFKSVAKNTFQLNRERAFKFVINVEIANKSCIICNADESNIVIDRNLGITCVRCCLQHFPLDYKWIAPRYYKFCPNRSKGCLFYTTHNFTIRKHMKWLCSYRGIQCSICSHFITNISCLQQHFEEMHPNNIHEGQYKNDTCSIILTNLYFNRWHCYVIKIQNTLFHFNIWVDRNMIHIDGVSDMPACETKMFLLYFMIEVPDGFFQRPIVNVSEDIVNESGVDWKTLCGTPEEVSGNPGEVLEKLKIVVIDNFGASGN